MDPISATIDQAEQLLGHSPHPAIVMLPLGALSVSNICDTLGMITGKRSFDDTARISLAIGLVGAAGAAVTGLRDYGKIPPDREPNHRIATTHGLGNAIAGTLMVGSYLLRDRDHRAGRRSGNAARLLSLAAGGLSLYTAWLGGKLVEEYGEAVHPAMMGQTGPIGQIESDDDHARGRERLDPESPLGVHDEGQAG